MASPSYNVPPKAMTISSSITTEDLKDKDGVQVSIPRLDDLLFTDDTVFHQTDIFPPLFCWPKPIVYLDLQVAGKSLGSIRIQLTCGPRRKDQLLQLCTAEGGNTWGGSHFDEARDVGQAGEYLMCQGYMTPVGDRRHTAIVPDMEGDECKMHVSGTVTQERGNGAGFIICTHTDPLSTDTMPELGRVVEGIDLLSQTMGQLTNKKWFGYNASDIKITEAGVQIDQFSFQQMKSK